MKRQTPMYFRLQKNAASLLLSLGFITLGSQPLHAERWIGSNEGNGSDWGLATNWFNNAIPGSGSTVDFNSTAVTQTVDLGGMLRSVGDVNFGPDAAYNFSNGTLQVKSLTINSAAHQTFNANLQFAEDTTLLFNAYGSASIHGSLMGSHRLTINSGSAPVVNLFGDNSAFSGGITLAGYARITLGSDTALGTGRLIVGSSNADQNSGVASAGTQARVITNEVEFMARDTGSGRFIALGNTVNNGKLTFQGATFLNGGVGQTTQLLAFSDVEFSGSISDSGTAAPLLVSGSSGAMITFSGSNSYLGGTQIGRSGSNDQAVLRVSNAHGLGGGDATITNTGRLSLSNAGTVANNIVMVGITDANVHLSSDGGDNVLSGTLTIRNGGYVPTIGVSAGTLTLEHLNSVVEPGNLRNYLGKSGTGTLIFAAGYLSGDLGAVYVRDGAVRGLGSEAGVVFEGTASSNAVIEGNGVMTRDLSNGVSANNVMWSANSSGGFAAHGGVFEIRLKNGTSTLTWGESYFVKATTALVFGSQTADSLVDFQNGLNLGSVDTAAAREVRVLDNLNAKGDYARISGVIAGAADKSLKKTGVGTLELTATNTYSGTTLINEGTLALGGNGSINNSAVTLNGGVFRNNSTVAYTGAFTFGSGTISGTNLKGSLGGLAIGAGQTLSPGNSPGTASTTSQTWDGGGTYLWEINNAIGTAGTDPGWDLVAGTGPLTITASNADQFTIKVISLTLANTAGDAANFQSDSNYSWLLADFASEISFDASAFYIDTSAFSNAYIGTFSLARGDTVGGSNSQLYIVYSVPEPSAKIWLAIAASACWMVRCRKRYPRG